MRYQVKIAAGAVREIKKLPEQISARILEEIDKLARNPRPPGVKKLDGMPDGYRIRTGVYRIVYVIGDDILKIDVVTVGHRKEVYRNLAEKSKRRGQ